MLLKDRSICGNCGKTYYNNETTCAECSTALTQLPKGTILIKKENFKPIIIVSFSISLILLITYIALRPADSSLIDLLFGLSISFFIFGVILTKRYKQILKPGNKPNRKKEDYSIPQNISRANKSYTFFMYICIIIFIMVVYLLAQL